MILLKRESNNHLQWVIFRLHLYSNFLHYIYTNISIDSYKNKIFLNSKAGTTIRMY